MECDRSRKFRIDSLISKFWMSKYFPYGFYSASRFRRILSGCWGTTGWIDGVWLGWGWVWCRLFNGLDVAYSNLLLGCSFVFEGFLPIFFKSFIYPKVFGSFGMEEASNVLNGWSRPRDCCWWISRDSGADCFSIVSPISLFIGRSALYKPIFT